MREQLLQPKPPESILRLQYPAGWQEILTAPDAADYQAWLGELTGMTYRICAEGNALPEWARDTEAITSRWQRAIELVADASIDLTDELTEAERVETGLLTLQNKHRKHGLGKRRVVIYRAQPYYRRRGFD
jgi:hypothetical protein